MLESVAFNKVVKKKGRDQRVPSLCIAVSRHFELKFCDSHCVVTKFTSCLMEPFAAAAQQMLEAVSADGDHEVKVEVHVVATVSRVQNPDHGLPSVANAKASAPATPATATATAPGPAPATPATAVPAATVSRPASATPATAQATAAASQASTRATAPDPALLSPATAPATNTATAPACLATTTATAAGPAPPTPATAARQLVPGPWQHTAAPQTVPLVRLPSVVGVQIADATVVNGKPFYVIYKADRYPSLIGIHHCEWRTLCEIWGPDFNPIHQVKSCKKFLDLNSAAEYFRRMHTIDRVEPMVFCH